MVRKTLPSVQAVPKMKSDRRMRNAGLMTSSVIAYMRHCICGEDESRKIVHTRGQACMSVILTRVHDGCPPDSWDAASAEGGDGSLCFELTTVSVT
jgi:hypothetical protein